MESKKKEKNVTWKNFEVENSEDTLGKGKGSDAVD